MTTAVRRRRARKFDRDVAEAAAAAASASANPFFDDEDERGNNGANWDPRRGSAHNAGYGKVRFIGWHMDFFQNLIRDTRYPTSDS